MSVDVVVAWESRAPGEEEIASLSPEEKARYAGMRNRSAAECFLGGRALARRLLSERLPAVAPREWRFAIGPAGKPSVASPGVGRDLHFNIAHTAGLVVATVADVPVGVDVEDRRRQARIEKIARRFFAPEEADWVLALPPDEMRAAFFEVWVMKEAVVKSRGDALGDHLATLSFVPGTDVGVVPAEPLPGMTLERYEHGPFLLGLAARSAHARIEVRPAVR